MQTDINNQVTWTWADLISSYRFWGLIIFFLCVISSQYFVTSYLSFYLQITFNIYTDHSLVYSVGLLGSVLSIIPAWLAYRANSYYALFVLAAIILISLGMLCLAASQPNLILLGLFLYKVSSGAILLLITGLIAKAINSVEMFVLSLSILKIFEFSCSVLGPLTAYPLSDSIEFTSLLLLYMVFIVIGCLLLLLAGNTLFDVAPRERKVHTQPHSIRSLILEFLLIILIPFYAIYWLVSVHREIRNYSQSAKLLTPMAAGFACLLVPFSVPIMLITLSDIADKQLYGEEYRKNRWGLILLSCFLFPISAIIIQYKLNQLLLARL